MSVHSVGTQITYVGILAAQEIAICMQHVHWTCDGNPHSHLFIWLCIYYLERVRGFNMCYLLFVYYWHSDEALSLHGQNKFSLALINALTWQNILSPGAWDMLGKSQELCSHMMVSLQISWGGDWILVSVCTLLVLGDYNGDFLHTPDICQASVTAYQTGLLWTTEYIKKTVYHTLILASKKFHTFQFINLSIS